MKPSSPHVLGALMLAAAASLAAAACAPALAPAPGSSAAPAAASGSAAPAVGQDRRPPVDGPAGNAPGIARKQVRDKWHGEFKGGFDAKDLTLLADKGRNVQVEKVSLKSGVVGPTGAIVLNGKGSAAVAGRPTREIAIVNTVNAPMSDAPNTLALTDATSGGKLDFTADAEFVRFTGKSAKGTFELLVNPDGTLTLDGKPTDGGDGTAKALAEGFAADASPEQLAMLEGLLAGSDHYAAQVGLTTLAPVNPNMKYGNLYKVTATGGFDPKPLVRAVLAKRLAP